DKLLKFNTVIRSLQKREDKSYFPLFLKFRDRTIYYYLPPQDQSGNQDLAIADGDTIFLINNWDIKSYKKYKKPVPLFLGQYGKKTEENDNKTTMRAEEFASKATGIDRLAYLRMDVDNLGKIFAKSLGSDLNLPRLAGLSGMMTYFFKVYLNSLAENREDNSQEFKKLTQSSRKNLLFIYAGGDDLFISGAWDEVVEFAFDIYQSFRAYTGYNPSITLSGGVSLATIKYPLYQAASDSGEMEDKAKGNGKDSLSLFGQTFKWGEWLGYNEKGATIPNQELCDYLDRTLPELLGVLPFVKKLNENQVDYPRSFVRNLLNTAALQEKAVKEAKEKFGEDSNYVKDTRYFLHLPKVAYTLSRLPDKLKENSALMTSLKSPYNAPYFRAIATWIELLNRQSSTGGE
ncbi:type III-A CRISPR-associated protein Cas10/Csm1, partial [Spirulina sp. 06S082]|uniref:type III-A CRISPR-associated protein Cas10/Csm1 n=1 Tax=Spirulina sp. 06S082 TaxID=3110248 RepID=UPI002B1F1BD7